MSDKLMIDTEEWVRQMQSAGVTATSYAMDIIFTVWFPGKEPLVIDEEAIIRHLNKIFTRRDHTVEGFRQHRQQIETFFTVLPDGRWVPNPRIFGVDEA